MKISLSKIISEVIREVVNGIRLRKISVNLITNSKGLDTVNITPIISSSNPKIKELFSESEMDWFELWPSSSGERMTIICAEGVLRYKFDDYSDHDGPNVSESLDIDTMKEGDWSLIKERIKPILDQNDINEAIKEVGQIKSMLQQHKGDKKTHQQELDDMGVVNVNRIDNYWVLTFNNGKKGVFRKSHQKGYEVVLPAVFDWVVGRGKGFKAIKGDDIFIFSYDNGWKVIEKEKIYDIFNNYADSLDDKAKRLFNKGNVSLEDLKKMVAEFFLHKMENYRGPEQDYWKEHYKEAVNSIVESVKNQ